MIYPTATATATPTANAKAGAGASTCSISAKTKASIYASSSITITLLFLLQMILQTQLQLTNAFTMPHHSQYHSSLHCIFNNNQHLDSGTSSSTRIRTGGISNDYRDRYNHNSNFNIHRRINRRCIHLHSSKTNQQEHDSATSTAVSLLDEIKQMRVRAIKQELDDAGISTADCFEKEELVQRLYDYKVNQKDSDPDDGTATTGTATKAPTATKGTSTSTIRVPMDFHSLTTQSVKSQRGDTFLRPSPGKFPSITVNLPTKGNQKINLLVDTACSGLILRPQVARNKLNLPRINTGVTMTAAGGTVGTDNSVCSLDCMELMDVDERRTKVRDLVVVAQDIGALPPVLDGIIGLSFLEKFHSVSFDFDCGELILHDCPSGSSSGSGKRKVVTEYENPMAYDVLAETNLSRSRLGIYIAQTTLDGRGPVKMIVDTGSAGTFLNWKGVGDMNMDRSHPLVSYNTESIGVMGADNNALALSHRFVVNRRVNFDSGGNDTVGMFAPGLELTDKVNVDIGDLPVLETMKYEGVGGILGSDILMYCDVVHMSNLIDRSSPPRLTLLKRREDGESYY